MTVRKISNTGSKKVIGKFPSLKMKTTVWWESQLERDFIYLLEIDPGVLTYSSQPFKLKYISDGNKRIYTPDFLVERKDKKQIVEVKPHRKAFSEKYQNIFRNVGPLLQNSGFQFLVVTERMIRVEPMLSNIKILYKYSRIKADYFQLSSIEKYLKAEEKAEVSRILNDLSPSDITGGHLYSLIYHGFLKADLMIPISQKSTVSLGMKEGDKFDRLSV